MKAQKHRKEGKSEKTSKKKGGIRKTQQGERKNAVRMNR
jgi:hypothetical protein